MEQLFFLLIPLFASSSIISAGNDTNISTTVPPNTTATSPLSVVSRAEVQKNVTSSSQDENGMTTHPSKNVSTTTAPVSSSHTGSTDGSSLTSHTTSGSTDGSGLSSHKTTVGVTSKTLNTANSNISMSEVTATPSQAPDSGLTLLAFGVMSFILILIVVMGVLVTAINLRGRCRNTKQHESIKSCDPVVSDSTTSNFEKESITLVSVRTINTENNTDSPQMSSVRSTIVDNDDQEFTRDLLCIKDGL